MDLLVTPRTTSTAVKAVDNGDGTVTVSGYLVVFDDPANPVKDLAGDYFTADTYFGAQKGNGVDTLFHHGIPIKAEIAHLADVILPPVTTKADDFGLFASTVLSMSDDYHAAIVQSARKGALGWSSGSAPHMVKRADDGHLKRWPIIEASLTPQPCEPRTVMQAVKTTAALAMPTAAKMLDFSGGTQAAHDRVSAAARDAFPGADYTWVADLYPDAAIVEVDGDAFRIPVADDGAAVTLADRAEWQPVERVTVWEAAKSVNDLFRAAPAASLAPDLGGINALFTSRAAA